eukprot:GHVL01015570.1.p1 GENE.GHVL01015570.1~~GHVL01015570.1.p1  ORF type:complete len:670 (-),score=106.06 GHVL01015570.1:1235-3244(-)
MRAVFLSLIVLFFVSKVQSVTLKLLQTGGKCETAEKEVRNLKDPDTSDKRRTTSMNCIAACRGVGGDYKKTEFCVSIVLKYFVAKIREGGAVSNCVDFANQQLAIPAQLDHLKTSLDDVIKHCRETKCVTSWTKCATEGLGKGCKECQTDCSDNDEKVNVCTCYEHKNKCVNSPHPSDECNKCVEKCSPPDINKKCKDVLNQKLQEAQTKVLKAKQKPVSDAQKKCDDDHAECITNGKKCDECKCMCKKVDPTKFTECKDVEVQALIPVAKARSDTLPCVELSSMCARTGVVDSCNRCKEKCSEETNPTLANACESVGNNKQRQCGTEYSAANIVFDAARKQSSKEIVASAKDACKKCIEACSLVNGDNTKKCQEWSSALDDIIDLPTEQVVWKPGKGCSGGDPKALNDKMKRNGIRTEGNLRPCESNNLSREYLGASVTVPKNCEGYESPQHWYNEYTLTTTQGSGKCMSLTANDMDVAKGIDSVTGKRKPIVCHGNKFSCGVPALTNGFDTLGEYFVLVYSQFNTEPEKNQICFAFVSNNDHECKPVNGEQMFQPCDSYKEKSLLKTKSTLTPTNGSCCWAHAQKSEDQNKVTCANNDVAEGFGLSTSARLYMAGGESTHSTRLCRAIARNADVKDKCAECNEHSESGAVKLNYIGISTIFVLLSIV